MKLLPEFVSGRAGLEGGKFREILHDFLVDHGREDIWKEPRSK
jgi:hypothetical protein